ncbi:ABC transporter ATP-binding protein [Streptomyces altiplanensis]
MTWLAASPRHGDVPPPPARAKKAGPPLGADLLRGDRWLLALAAVLSLASAASALAVPWLAIDVTDSFTRHQPIARPATVMSLAVLGTAGLQALSGWLLAGVGQRAVLRLRDRVVDHILRLPLRTVRDEGAGSLTARITSDAALVHLLVETGLVHLPVALLAAAATLTAMAVIDPVLTLVAAGAFGLAGLCVAVLTARMKFLSAAQQHALGRLAQGVTAHLDALVTVKASRHETSAARTLGQAAAAVRAASLPAARLQCLVGPVVSLGQQVAILAVALAAGQQITRGQLDLAAFSGFFLYLLHLTSPLTVAALGIGHLQAGRIARSRFHCLLSLSQEPDVPGPLVLPVPRSGAHAVVFHGVSFRHPQGSTVLDRVDFHAPAVGLTALIGFSGAGKSTVLNLVNRLAQADQGEIHVLGRPVRAWPLDDLRRRVAYVDQHSTLVEGTVRENLQLGLVRTPGDEELLDALERVGLRRTVLHLPHALDTPLGRAQELSGGQRQRLAMARALLTDSEIVLLDEPTSHLDAVSDCRITRAIYELAATRCVLVASHRLSTVRSARHVVLLTGGGTVVSGSHEDLLAGDDVRYRGLVAGDATVPFDRSPL